MNRGPTYHELTRLHPALMLHLDAAAVGMHVEIRDEITGQILTVLGADEAVAWINVLDFRGIAAIETHCRLHGRRRPGHNNENCTCAKVFRSRLLAATAKALENRKVAI